MSIGKAKRLQISSAGGKAKWEKASASERRRVIERASHAAREARERRAAAYVAMQKALEPFAAFLDAFEAKPIRGLDPVTIYSIHAGEDAANLEWGHLRAARKALEMAKLRNRITHTPGRWAEDTYIVDGSVVGTVREDSFGRGWWAYGCLKEWEDTKLGQHAKESQARHRVEQWVKDHD